MLTRRAKQKVLTTMNTITRMIKSITASALTGCGHMIFVPGL